MWCGGEARVTLESDDQIEVGGAQEALGWIERSGLVRQDRRRLEALVHRFPEQRFYREREAGLDWVEREAGVRLAPWYRRLRQALAFVAPGELEAVRLDGEQARRPLHEQDSWYAFDLLGVPQVERRGGEVVRVGKLLAVARNCGPNWDLLTIAEGGRGQEVKLLYPDARRLELPRSARQVFDDYLRLIEAVQEIRLRDGQRIRSRPARPVESRLEMVLRIDLEGGASMELFCIEHEARLRAEPGGTVRGWIDYQAQLFEDFTGERFGTLEVSARIEGDALRGRLRTPMSRRGRDTVEFEGFDEGGDGIYRCELGADLRLQRAGVRLRFDGRLELWLCGAWEPPQEPGGLAKRVLEQLEALGGRIEPGGGGCPGPLGDALDRMRLPVGARYTNFGLTMPQVRRLRFVTPEERRVLDPREPRLACDQGERPLALLGEDRETDRLVLLACDGRQPADPLLYLVARDQPTQKLGHGVHLSTFLRSLAPRHEI